MHFPRCGRSWTLAATGQGVPHHSFRQKIRPVGRPCAGIALPSTGNCGSTSSAGLWPRWTLLTRCSKEPSAESTSSRPVGLGDNLGVDGKGHPGVGVAEPTLGGLDVHALGHEGRGVGSPRSWKPAPSSSALAIAGSHVRIRHCE
jgi:hypothetical protein